MADSRLLVGGRPVASIAACWVSLQLLLKTVVNPDGPCSSSVGSASASVIPKRVKEGPIARTITFFGPLPVTMKPPMPSLPAAARTFMRVEKLTACAAGTAVGLGLAGTVADGLAEGVPDGVAVGVADGVTVAEAEGVAVADGLGVGDGHTPGLKISIVFSSVVPELS